MQYRLAYGPVYYQLKDELKVEVVLLGGCGVPGDLMRLVGVRRLIPVL